MISTTAARTKANLEAAEIPAAVLARVYGIPSSTLMENLRGTGIYLGAEKERDLYELSRRIAALAEALRPLAVRKNDPEGWKALLESGIEPGRIRELVSEVFGRE